MAHVQCHAYLFLLSIYRVYYMYDLACETGWKNHDLKKMEKIRFFLI